MGFLTYFRHFVFLCLCYSSVEPRTEVDEENKKLRSQLQEKMSEASRLEKQVEDLKRMAEQGSREEEQLQVGTQSRDARDWESLQCHFVLL